MMLIRVEAFWISSNVGRCDGDVDCWNLDDRWMLIGDVCCWIFGPVGF